MSSGHELMPGEPIRFKSTGEIGIVEKVKAPNCRAWWLKWVGRPFPVLERMECSLSAVEWVYSADFCAEIWPKTIYRKFSFFQRLRNAISVFFEKLD